MICPRCDRRNGEARRFCGDCGTSLEVACGVCDFVNDAVDRFCGGCGGQIGTGVLARAAATGDVPMLSTAELHALLADLAVAPTQAATLPMGPIGQDDLDRLFGGGS